MKTITFLVLTFSYFTISAQNIHSNKYQVEIKNSYLDTNSTAQVEQLLENTAAIQFVSLLPLERQESISKDSTLSVFTFGSITSQNQIVDKSRVKRRATLHHNDVATLMSILCPQSILNSSQSCYQPRHGIQFLDSTGKLLAFIEISFDCADLTSTGIPLTSQLGTEEYAKLRGIFDKYMGDYMSHYDIN